MTKSRSQSHVERAMTAALKLLSIRARTCGEIDQALSRRGFDHRDRVEALDRLASLGYVDDERFARDRAESLLRRGSMGAEAVVQRLTAHGLSQRQAKDAVEDLVSSSEFDEARMAERLLKKRRFALPPRTFKDYARAARLLQFKGFGEATISTVLGQIVDSRAEDD